jgi:hypothetical protein
MPSNRIPGPCAWLANAGSCGGVRHGKGLVVWPPGERDDDLLTLSRANSAGATAASSNLTELHRFRWANLSRTLDFVPSNYFHTSGQHKLTARIETPASADVFVAMGPIAPCQPIDCRKFR